MKNIIKKSNKNFSSKLTEIKKSNLISQTKLVILFLFFSIQAIKVEAIPYIVSTNFTINSSNVGSLSLADGIVVSNLGVQTTLIIDGVTINFNPGALIDVEEGAHLEVINSTLTSNNSTSTWLGVYGDGKAIDNYISPPDDTEFWNATINPDQTKITVQGSTISHANYGVKVYDGAILFSRNSNYTDCKVGCDFSIFTVSSVASHIMDCSYSWSDDYLFSTSSPIGISINACYGVNIGGCNFTNTISDITCYDEEKRGIGIYAASAGLVVGQSGDEDCTDSYGCPANCYSGVQGPGCTFNKLDKGIFYENGYPVEYSLVIRKSSFNDNKVAIHTVYTENTKIIGNTFNVNRTVLDGFYNLAMGCSSVYSSTTLIDQLVFDDGAAYEVYDNSFSTVGTHIRNIYSVGNSTELHLNQRIKNNTFTSDDIRYTMSDNVYGIYCEGSAPNLEILCNTFEDQGCDIFTNNDGMSNTMQNKQDFSGADNVFSDVLMGRYRIYNTAAANPIKYYCTSSDNNKNPNYLSTSLNVTLETSTEEPICTLTCEDFYVKTTNLKNIQNADNSSINLYPNPTNHSFSINSNFEINNVVIYNSIGQVVKLFEKPYISANNELLIDDLSNGLYWVYIKSDATESYIVKKLTIE